MRLNKYLAMGDFSRRAADAAIAAGRITVNGQPATLGQAVDETVDRVMVDGTLFNAREDAMTILFHKPSGIVVSRHGQGSRTIYEILPRALQHLNPIGRLDKHSSGLLLLTTDGQLAQELTHPRYEKQKVYEIRLNKPLAPLHHQMITDMGIMLHDGVSRLQLDRLDSTATFWQVTMHEGRNRQIRRTFESLGYTVTYLHRTHFGVFSLGDLPVGAYRVIDASDT